MVETPPNVEQRTAAARARHLARAIAASWREAFGGADAIGVGERRAIVVLSGIAGAVIFALAWQRYATFHNRNFDLAFYARLAWGESHGDSWEPLLDAHVWGLHFVWVLEILGWIGRLLGQVRTLLFAQSVAVVAASWPIARIAARVFAEARGAASPSFLARHAPVIAACTWLLQPNLWHVATCDFHPGTLAVLPLAWCCESLHRRNAHGLVWSALGVLACREDLGLVVVMFGLALFLRDRAASSSPRRSGLFVALGALSYVGLFLGVFHPRFAPANGSFVQHFAAWGEGPLSAVLGVVSQPMRLVSWLAAEERAPYLLVITAPLAFLVFLAPEWLLLAAPVLAMNLLSSFPTTLFLDSHYLTPALPILVIAAVVGAGRLGLLARVPSELALAPLLLCAAIAHVLHGGSPISLRYDRLAYRADATTDALSEAVARIPEDASVQAPERVLAHLAERRRLRRGPPPETISDFVIFDAWHRRVDAHREELLRTEEEPLLRDWLARDDHALVHAGDGIYLLERGAPRERDVGLRHVVGRADASEGEALTTCLALLGASITSDEGAGATLTLELGARDACPSDLALRVGWGYRPRRVDLIADGELSPARFRAGARIRSSHRLSAEEREAITHRGLRVGAVRQSGARPEPGDPAALDVSLRPAE